MKKKFQFVIVDSIREIVFGLEDSLVSTLGAITGIAFGSNSTYIVILSGLVLIVAESTSMAAGSYLSSKNAFEAENGFHHAKSRKLPRSGRAALVMGVSYFIGGFVPLTPYFILPINQAVYPSVILTVVSLFLVGTWTATYTKRSKLKSGLEITGISLFAALVGYLIGVLVHYYLGV